jgi:hypothetical protein
MSRDLLQGFGEPRTGLAHDPCWDRYRRWDWSRFPLRFPACTAAVRQEPIHDPASAVVLWEIGPGVPLVGRMTDGDGRIVLEVLPAADGPAVETVRLAGPDLPARIGFGFEWVFFAPLRRYQPTKPLGVVIADAGRVRGLRTVITVTARS